MASALDILSHPHLFTMALKRSINKMILTSFNLKKKSMAIKSCCQTYLCTFSLKLT